MEGPKRKSRGEGIKGIANNQNIDLRAITII